VAVAFTACLRFRTPTALDDTTRTAILAALFAGAAKHEADVLAWCLMPDHLHAILRGQSDSADTRLATAVFKQKSGFWLAQNRPQIEWQKDFYDHIIRSDENLEVQVLYAVNNPVRAELVARWWDYPHTGGSTVEAMRKEIVEYEA
jgi:putative transposase